MAKYVFSPRDGSKRGGYVPAIYSGHELLIHARLTHDKHPDATRIFEAGKPFEVDEAFEQDLLEFCRANNNFKLVTRDWLQQHQPDQFAKEF